MTRDEIALSLFLEMLGKKLFLFLHKSEFQERIFDWNRLVGIFVYFLPFLKKEYCFSGSKPVRLCFLTNPQEDAFGINFETFERHLQSFICVINLQSLDLAAVKKVVRRFKNVTTRMVDESNFLYFPVSSSFFCCKKWVENVKEKVETLH